jgi:hypothetical protein
MFVSNSFGQIISVPNGYGSGNEYLKMDDVQKYGYVNGAINGMLSASMFVKPIDGKIPETRKWLADYVKKGLTIKQAVAILEKYLEEHPEDLHLPLTMLVPNALVDAYHKAYPNALPME